MGEESVRKLNEATQYTKKFETEQIKFLEEKNQQIKFLEEKNQQFKDNSDEIQRLKNILKKTAAESVKKLNGLSLHIKQLETNNETESQNKLKKLKAEKDKEINNNKAVLNEALDKLNKLTELHKKVKNENNKEIEILRDKLNKLTEGDKTITDKKKNKLEANKEKELERELKQTQLTLSQNLITLENLQKYMRNRLGNEEVKTVVRKARNGQLGLKVK